MSLQQGSLLAARGQGGKSLASSLLHGAEALAQLAPRRPSAVDRSRNGINALELWLEYVVQVLPDCGQRAGHDAVGLGQDLLREVPAALGTRSLGLHSSTLLGDDCVRLHTDSDDGASDLGRPADVVRGVNRLPGLELLADRMPDLEHDGVTDAP